MRVAVGEVPRRAADHAAGRAAVVEESSDLLAQTVRPTSGSSPLRPAPSPTSVGSSPASTMAAPACSPRPRATGRRRRSASRALDQVVITREPVVGLAGAGRPLDRDVRVGPGLDVRSADARRPPTTARGPAAGTRRRHARAAAAVSHVERRARPASEPPAAQRRPRRRSPMAPVELAVFGGSRARAPTGSVARASRPVCALSVTTDHGACRSRTLDPLDRRSLTRGARRLGPTAPRRARRGRSTSTARRPRVLPVVQLADQPQVRGASLRSPCGVAVLPTRRRGDRPRRRRASVSAHSSTGTAAGRSAPTRTACARAGSSRARSPASRRPARRRCARADLGSGRWPSARGRPASSLGALARPSTATARTAVAGRTSRPARAASRAAAASTGSRTRCSRRARRSLTCRELVVRQLAALAVVRTRRSTPRRRASIVAGAQLVAHVERLELLDAVRRLRDPDGSADDRVEVDEDAGAQQVVELVLVRLVARRPAACSAVVSYGA